VIGPASTLANIAFEVCTALEQAGYRAVLTGGSAATYYAPDAYQSGDLDFVITLTPPKLKDAKKGERALASLGFQKKANAYRHPRTHFVLEFPKGPLGVGDELIHRWSTVRRRKQTLHVLSPTDSCRDRLASFLFWNDFSGLEQAIAVQQARADEVDLKIIEGWCKKEGHPQKFALFASRLSKPRT
jgi:hypothetical protein